jgi:hypothetical protein
MRKFEIDIDGYKICQLIYGTALFLLSIITLFNQVENIWYLISLFLFAIIILIQYFKNKLYRVVNIKVYVDNNKDDPVMTDYRLAKNIAIERVEDILFSLYLIEFLIFKDIEDLPSRKVLLKNMSDALRLLEIRFSGEEND